MNSGVGGVGGVGSARIGQWYLRWDKGEVFQVTGDDGIARTVEIQTFDGDLYAIDYETWHALPLGLAEPPEGWTGPVDDLGRDDPGDSQSRVRGADWAEPLESYRPAPEARQIDVENLEDTAEVEVDVAELARASRDGTA